MRRSFPEDGGNDRAAAALRRAARLNERGLRDKACGRLDHARRRYRRALGLLRRGAPGDRDALAVLHHNLGGIEYAEGNWAAGERWARAGIGIRLAGPVDPSRLACDLIALAALVDGAGRRDEAERLYLAGLGLLRTAARPDPVELAVALNGLGVNYARRGHGSAAVRLLERALELKRRWLAPDSASLALAAANLERARRIREDRRGSIGSWDHFRRPDSEVG